MYKDVLSTSDILGLNFSREILFSFLRSQLLQEALGELSVITDGTTDGRTKVFVRYFETVIGVVKGFS